MRKARNNSGNRNKFFKKDSSAEKKGRPFEKFRKDDSREEKRNKEHFRKDRPATSEGGDSASGKERKPFRDKPFRKNFKRKDFKRKDDAGTERPSGDKNPVRRENPSFAGEKKKSFKKWEKPSVFFQRKKHGFTERSGSDALKGPELIRLNRYIANAGVCSRREADQMIENGLVSVNGQVITQLGTKIKLDDLVKYGGETLRREKEVYLLLNKPKDYITTAKDTHDRKTVMELVGTACKERIYPVGRLDRNTTGVLLLTNDGEMTKKLTHPKYGAKKIYHVETDKNVTHQDLKKLTEGILLEEDGMVKADEAHYAGENLAKNQVGVVLHAGKNRVVRRMFEAMGYNVAKLDRVSFAGLTKKDLQRGKWRFLSEKEIAFLKMLKGPAGKPEGPYRPRPDKDAPQKDRR